jgi:hypothetical protein
MNAAHCFTIPYAWLPRLSQTTRDELLDSMLGSNLSRPTPATTDEEMRSFPVTLHQAAALIPSLDQATVRVLRRAAENYCPATRRGEIRLADVQELCGVKDHDAFVRAHLSPLERCLRSLTGNADAVLLIGDDSWDWINGVNDYAAVKYYIDDPAVLTLRQYFAMPNETAECARLKATNSVKTLRDRDDAPLAGHHPCGALGGFGTGDCDEWEWVRGWPTP